MVYPQLTPEQREEILRLANGPKQDAHDRGPKIAAIKAYREITAEGLKEAKDAVEALIADQPKPALLDSLPGDIPGLLRRGSPIVDYAGIRRVVNEVTGSGCRFDGDGRTTWNGEFILDLTDPTGRAHAAAWVDHHVDTAWPGTVAESQALFSAAYFHDMTPEACDILCRLVLRLAGREGWTP